MDVGDSQMLDPVAVGVQKFRPHCAHIGLCRLRDHGFQPPLLHDFYIIIEKQQILSRCLSPADVAHGRKIERHLPVQIVERISLFQLVPHL